MTTLSSLLLAVTVVAHDPGYVTSLANHISRWLGSEGVASKVVTPAEMPKALWNEKIAFLVGFANPSKAELEALRNFRSRGGKLVVFHASNPTLAQMMGVKVVGYASAPYPGAWSRMKFDTSVLGAAPPNILQTSTVLNRAVPIAGRGRVLATWLDRQGRDSREAAWIQTDAGWWMTHVLLADGDEALKARLVAAMCGAADPKLWNAAQSAARVRQKEGALEAYAKKQTARPGEIHAVWEHSGCGLYPGDWPRTMRRLKAAHVTDLFVNVAGSGFAHYPSDVLPRSKIFAQEGDQLAKCLAAAKGTGIRVHAWVLCFTATRGASDVIASYRQKGWTLRKKPDAGGGQTEYLDASIPAVRNRLLSAMDELQSRYPGLAGIHLDFVRFDEFCVQPRNTADIIARFVADARRHVKKPMWLTAAVFGHYPRCIGAVGQDWCAWLDAQLVDYVVPMDYSNSLETFTGYVAQHAESKARARRTIAGIGVTANESRLDARQVIDQINVSRRYGLAGNALFDLDTTLDKNILPYLSMGAW